MHSLYEIETTVKRSAKSQGLSWGTSEEIGKAIRLLEQSEMGGLESFKRLLDKGLSNLVKLKMIDQIDTNNLCPIHFGLFYLDQSHKSDLQKEIKFQSIFEPLIIIPFLQRASKRNLLYFQINSSELNMSITPGGLLLTNKNEIPSKLDNFSINLTNKRRVNYSDQTWKQLYELSLETFVEESEEKKLSGAGAGLTDND